MRNDPCAFASISIHVYRIVYCRKPFHFSDLASALPPTTNDGSTGPLVQLRIFCDRTIATSEKTENTQQSVAAQSIVKEVRGSIKSTTQQCRPSLQPNCQSLSRVPVVIGVGASCNTTLAKTSATDVTSPYIPHELHYFMVHHKKKQGARVQFRERLAEMLQSTDWSKYEGLTKEEAEALFWQENSETSQMDPIFRGGKKASTVKARTKTKLPMQQWRVKVNFQELMRKRRKQKMKQTPKTLESPGTFSLT